MNSRDGPLSTFAVISLAALQHVARSQERACALAGPHKAPHAAEVVLWCFAHELNGKLREHNLSHQPSLDHEGRTGIFWRAEPWQC